MRRKYLQHITAFLLSWIMVIHGVLILTPEQEKVLCVAEDHIAIEVPTVWINSGAAGVTGQPKFFHDYHGPAGDTCIDIPLETRTLVDHAGYSDLLQVLAVPAFQDIFPFSIAEEHSSLFQKYPPGHVPYQPERYAVRSRVLLI